MYGRGFIRHRSKQQNPRELDPKKPSPSTSQGSGHYETLQWFQPASGTIWGENSSVLPFLFPPFCLQGDCTEGARFHGSGGAATVAHRLQRSDLSLIIPDRLQLLSCSLFSSTVDGTRGQSTGCDNVFILIIAPLQCPYCCRKSTNWAILYQHGVRSAS